MADPTGIAGAWLERVSRYGSRALERITQARVDIEAGNYDSRRFFRDALAWSDDTLYLWAPLALRSAVPAAVIVLKNDMTQGAMQEALEVDAPDAGGPVATNIRQLDGGRIIDAATEVRVGWEADERGKLTFALVGLNSPLQNGYYVGAVFVGQRLVANTHVRVVDP